MDDPRVFFAAERTALAWVRTGIATIGLGFVVARFGLFLHYLTQAAPQTSRPVSSLVIGVLLVVIGSGTCMVAGAQFWWFMRHLQREELPPRYFVHLATIACFALSAVGLVLALFLVC